MTLFMKSSYAIFVALATVLRYTHCHGIMLEPPSRASAFRVGFPTPPNFNDMESFCGGFERQWLVNKGRCGICGDPFDEQIKPHEAPGGLFATGTIVRRYTKGQVIPVTVRLTATHRGFYEFKLCPNNNVRQDPSQECFDRFPLTVIDNQGAAMGTRFTSLNLTPASYQVRLQLPPEVTCTQCIIQWNYITGNRWGICPNGTGQLGCGPQETFRACADVAIDPAEGSGFIQTTPPTTPIEVPTVSPGPTIDASTMIPSPPPLVTPTTPQPTQAATPFSPPGLITPGPTTQQPDAGCVRWGASAMVNVPGLPQWCTNNCRIGHCPSQFCVCLEQ